MHTTRMQAMELASTADMWDRDACAERAAALTLASRAGVLSEVCDRLRAQPVPRCRRSVKTWLAEALWLDAELRAAGVD